jgi:OmpA family
MLPRPSHDFRGITATGGPNGTAPLSVNLYVNFAYDSADLTSDARITLDRLGYALIDDRLKNFSFTIEGHTDAKGSADYNQKLSERRAEAVRECPGDPWRCRARVCAHAVPPDYAARRLSPACRFTGERIDLCNLLVSQSRRLQPRCDSRSRRFARCCRADSSVPTLPRRRPGRAWRTAGRSQRLIGRRALPGHRRAELRT